MQHSNYSQDAGPAQGSAEAVAKTIGGSPSSDSSGEAGPTSGMPAAASSSFGGGR